MKKQVTSNLRPLLFKKVHPNTKLLFSQVLKESQSNHIINDLRLDSQPASELLQLTEDFEISSHSRTPRQVTFRKMKLKILSSVTALLALLTAASASLFDEVFTTLRTKTTVPQPIITPTTGHVNQGEQKSPELSKEEQADQYLFNMTLESFITLRDERYPSYFWWESDGCSQSPDTPFGFPFLPACYHHDFGHDQYKHVRISLHPPLISPSSF